MYYSGKKKRHCLKTQVVVDKNTQKIVCTKYANGKKHDFKIFKESNVHFSEKTRVVADTGYLGLDEIHANTDIPKKKSKNNPLSIEEKKLNQQLSSERILNEHVFGKIKRFKIVSDRYRNRRKRFGLRFNLLAGIYNFELQT